jgi:Domain of unknown function (DUF4326)
MMPKRWKVKGDYFHGVVPEQAVYVGRAAPGLPESSYANPFKVGEPIPPDYGGGVVIDAIDAVALYQIYLDRHPELVKAARAELRGRDLACWCPEDDGSLAIVGRPCHADVLLAVSNEETADA